MKSSILLIYTGGTIGMKPDPVTGVLIPYDFKNLEAEFPRIKFLDVELDVIVFDPIDSSNVTPELWIALAEIIKENYRKYDGFVILHGTDTMSFTSSALSFMLDDLCKPVIFTGSQIPIGVLRTDGRENLITAIEIAAARTQDGRAMVPEVCLYFQNKLFRANRTTKYSAEDLNAFRSENYPSLADVGVNITFNRNYIHYPESYPDDLRISTAIENNIMIIKLFPGMPPGILRSLIGTEGVKGIVLETYGSGNAPTSEEFICAVKSAVDRGIPVMDVTQCISGSVRMELYETGIRLQKIGVISGKDITTEAAVTKMMYVMGNYTGYADAANRLKTSLKGEINS